MTDPILRFYFASSAGSFGPFETYEAAAVAAVEYAKGWHLTDTRSYRSWPSITISQIREYVPPRQDP
jgi:hypothetical protein